MAHLFRAGGTYSAFRPTYPPELYDRVLAFAGLAGLDSAPRRLAVDIATGSGQAARDLAARFERVVAVDGSPQQLEHAARDVPNIEFRLADAHATGLPAGRADLVTVAQALHWLDRAAFYREARRLLAPSGALAAWCYGLATVEAPGHPVDEALRDVFSGALGSYWDARRGLVDALYQGMEPVEGLDFEMVGRQRFDMRHATTVDGLVGYVSSWSSYSTYAKSHGKEAGEKVLGAFRGRVLAALGAGATGGTKVTLVTPIALILGRGPLPVGQAGGGAAAE